MTKLIIPVTLSDMSEFIGKLNEYLYDPKPSHLMTVGTLMAGYFLYQNYFTVLKEKRRRRALSEMSPDPHGILPQLLANSTIAVSMSTSKPDCPTKSKQKHSRGIFLRILSFDGVFNSMQSLNQILSKVWVPSIERGLAITKNRNIRGYHTAWHYSEFYDPHKRDRGTGSSTFVSISSGLPENLRYLLNISRVFGQSTFEDILRLNEYVDYVNIPHGSNLFSINEPDDKIYIVLTGVLQLNFLGDDGEFHMIKQLRPGDQIISLLSFIDYVMGKQGIYRTVQTVALLNSDVMKIPMSAFGDILMSDPVSLAKGLQRTLRRVYEVIFTACHQILGLTQELIKEKPRLPVPPLDDIPVFVKPSKNICEDAATKLMTKFSIMDRSLLADCSVLTVPQGFVIFEPGENDHKSVVYVYEGELEVGLTTPSYLSRTGKEIAFYINADEIFGSLVFLTNDARQFSVRTSTKSIIVHIPDKTLIAILERHPLVVIPLMESIFSRLSPFTRQMDFGIEWTYVESGQALFHAKDEPNATYLVLNGRLRSYISNARQQVEQFNRLVGQYGRFDLVGLVEMWTNRKRTKTVLAVRGTELAKIPRDFITAICRRHAKVAFQILQYLTRRMVNTYKTSIDISSMLTVDDAFESAATHCTVALFPISDDVPITYIAKEFAAQYEKFGKILILNSTVVQSRLEEEIFTSGNFDSTLTAWLCSQETKYTHILYIADSKPTEWSVKCFHQADIIFVVVNQEGNKEISEIERMILSGDSLAKKELLICHKCGSHSASVPKMPRWTKLWLEHRPWLDFHHHVFVESIYYEMTTFQSSVDSRVPFESRTRNRDIARVVRWLTGNTFGLALGGGGAKGAAHIGFLREFHKIKLPIDFMCGVSIDVDKVEKISKDWFFQLIYGEKYTMDLTLPFVSFFTGDSLNCSLMEIFGDLQIEDLRIPYIICTTDLTNNTIREHRCGSLWRFVRASMTIINYFPPICDPRDGHYLIDGGYTNLVPADILRKLGVRYIMAVDISSKNNTYRNTNYGDSISGVNLLTHTLPIFSNVSVPSILEIQERLNWAQSVVYLNLLKRMEASRHAESPSIVYIRLPIDLHTTSDFKRFDKIRDIGCTFAQRVLAHINPGDSIEIIWQKLKYNRGNQRFGSLEGQGDDNQSQDSNSMYDDDENGEEVDESNLPPEYNPPVVDLNETALHLYSVSLHSSTSST